MDAGGQLNVHGGGTGRLNASGHSNVNGGVGMKCRLTLDCAWRRGGVWMLD
jgi:hypothetical protein